MTVAKDFHEFFKDAAITMVDGEKVVGFYHIDASAYSAQLVRVCFDEESDKDYYYVAGSGHTIVDGEANFVMYGQAEHAENGIRKLTIVPEFFKKMKF
mgnify:CR=1 FL=1